MPAKTSTSQLGRVIRGYCLERFLSSEMATLLYHAHTEELWLPPDVLIRLIPLPENLTAAARVQFLQRFEREARGLIRLRHPSLFPLFGYGKLDSMVYLLSPCALEETLAARLQRQRHWTPAEIFALLTPLATVLDMLHQRGLVCQFLNPTWIFLPEHQPPQIANIRLAQMVCRAGLDLPLAHTSQLPTCLQALDTSPLGWPEYLAPEVVKGAAPDARSDIYSLGTLLFELLCGQPPFTGTDYLAIARHHLLETPPPLRELVPDLPVALEIVLNRALHHDPRARYQSARELVTACSTALHERVRRANFSLRASLLAQREGLPTPRHIIQPLQIAGPVSQEPEEPRDQDEQPSSPEEQLADAWLNTPGESEQSHKGDPITGASWPIFEQSRRETEALHPLFQPVPSQGETY